MANVAKAASGPTAFCLFVFCMSFGTLVAQTPAEDKDNFLRDMLEAETVSNFLSSKDGAALTSENLFRRNTAIARWSKLYLHQDDQRLAQGEVIDFTKASITSWWRDPKALGDKQSSLILTNPHSTEVRIFGKVVVKGIGPVVEVMLKDGKKIVGAKVSENDGELVIKTAEDASESKILKAEVEAIKSLELDEPKPRSTSTVLRELIGSKGLVQWKSAISRFAENAPPWELFTINERDRVIGYYRFSVEDLSSSLTWDYPFATEKDLVFLSKDMLRLPDAKDTAASVVLQVGTQWNQLITGLSTAPEPRKGPVPEGGGEPPVLPPRTADEVVEGIRESVLTLQTKLSELAVGGVITTDLEPLVNQLTYIHRYRQLIEREDANPLLEAFKNDQKQFVSLFAAFSLLGTDATQETRDAALQQLNNHWTLMQERVAKAATLRTQVQECIEYRSRLLLALGTALKNNRVPLVESCALQLGRRLTGVVDSWDTTNRYLRFSWDKALWKNNAADVSRTEARDFLASSLASTLGEIPQQLNSETLLQERGFLPGVDGSVSFSTRTVSLDDIVNLYRQQIGSLPADAPVRINATTHRITLNGNNNGVKRRSHHKP